MKIFFLILKHTSINSALIYFYDSIVLFIGKIIYHITIYKKSIHSSVFDVIKYSKTAGVLLKSSKNDYSLSFSIKNKPTTVSLRKKTSDMAVFKEIFIADEYLKLIELIQERNIQIKTIIDAGSNIGMTILYFERHFPNSTIIGIEPDSFNFLQIKKNLELNQLNEVILEKAGIWDKESNLKITKGFRNGDSWSLSVEECDDEGDVQGISIDFLLSKYQFPTIDLLKIDIEGSESQIFSAPYCLFLKKTKVICIEAHDEVNSKPLIVNTLSRYDFDIFFDGDIIFGVNKFLI